MFFQLAMFFPQDGFWRKAGMDMCMNAYKCVSTGDELGFLEAVGNSNTLAGIVSKSCAGGSKLRKAYKAYSDTPLIEWLKAQPYDFERVQLENFVRSTAALRVIAMLDFPWNSLSAFILLPTPVRDAAYKLVAKHRYAVFGQVGECRAPTERFQSRFLDYDPAAAGAAQKSPFSAE